VCPCQIQLTEMGGVGEHLYMNDAAGDDGELPHHMFLEAVQLSRFPRAFLTPSRSGSYSVLKPLVHLFPPTNHTALMEMVSPWRL
jgi:hypothetical protein